VGCGTVAGKQVEVEEEEEGSGSSWIGEGKKTGDGGDGPAL